MVGESWLTVHRPPGGPSSAGLLIAPVLRECFRPTLVATVQALSIVVGHLLGVLAAHERAITVLPRRAAVIGQVPLMVVMILYTVSGLTILFTP